MKTFTSLVAVCAMAFAISGCAASLRNPNIADVQRNAGHYADRTVTIDGTVTSSWGVPLVPLKLYFNDKGRAKIELAVARGKKLHDKRETERKRTWERERGRLLRLKG